MEMYIYNHCPYCVRPRIIADFKKLDISLHYLANDDEKVHLDLIGRKQVPFLKKDDGSFLIESLDICAYLDIFDGNHVLAAHDKDSPLLGLIERLSKTIRPIVYARMIHHPQNSLDFPTQSARDYFQHKKEKYLGDFKAIERFPLIFAERAEPILNDIDLLMRHLFATSDRLSWDDITVFPILRNLTISRDLIAIPANINRYLDFMANMTKIDLYTIN
ncbi:MAG: glutaredoxin 2 [Francisellaceae bacterium]